MKLEPIRNSIFDLYLRDSNYIFITDESVELTYTEVKNRVREYTTYFKFIGLLPEHRICLMADNCAEAAVFFIAAIRYCSLSTFPENLPDILYEKKAKALNINASFRIKDKKLLSHKIHHFEPTKESEGEYHFWWSSGSSGKNEDFSIMDRYGKDPMVMSLAVMPHFTHKYGVEEYRCVSTNAGNCWHSEGIIISYTMHGSFHCCSYDNIESVIDKYKPRFLNLQPNGYKKVLKRLKHHHRMKVIFSGGAPLEDSTRKMIEQKFDNPPIINLYGPVEVGWMTAGEEGLGPIVETEQGTPFIEDGKSCFKFKNGSIYRTEDFVHQENDNWHFDYRADTVQQTSNTYQVYVEDMEYYLKKRFKLKEVYLNNVDDVTSMYYVGIMPEHHKNIVREEITHPKLQSAIPDKYYQMEAIEFPGIKINRRDLPEMYENIKRAKRE